MTQMTESELTAILDGEIRQSVGYGGGKMAEMRRKAEAYYLGIPAGDLSPPEVEGRSSVVVPYVRNVIEAMLPQLMVKFTGGDSVVEFEATKPGDEGKAGVCTDYLNYLFWKKNAGHSIAYAWMKDALLLKRGFIKVWWDDRSEESKEEYRGQTDVNLAMLMDDPEVEITTQRAYPDEDDVKQRQQAIEHLTQQMQQAMQAAQQSPQAAQAAQQAQQQLQGIHAQPPAVLYDVTVKRTKKGGKVCIENVPPEEFRISRDAKDIRGARLTGHVFQRTASELLSIGYPKARIDELSLADDDNAEFNAERTERNGWDDELAGAGAEGFETSDKSQRRFWVSESYLRVDWDGDGIAETRKITKAGNVILDNEECDGSPFVSICPVPMPHKFFGLSVADLGMETQKTETSILRAVLDDLYLRVNGRNFALEGQVNTSDLLNNRPGGVVRIKSIGAVGPLNEGRGDSRAGMEMLEYMQTFGEASTGWTRYSQGNDAKAIQGTATGANIITNKDDMRLDLIARHFAEGWVELFRLMLKLVCQYQNKSSEVRLGGAWVPIDPREWANQFDININVGLGVGNKDQQVQHLMAVIAQQEKVHAIGVASPGNIFKASEDLAKLTGQKNGDKYFSDPSKQPPAPPKPDPEVIKAQAAQQLAQVNGQVTLQVEQQKAQVTKDVSMYQAQLKAQVDQAEQQAQQAQTTVQQQNDMALQREKYQMDAQLKRDEMDRQLAIRQMELAAEADQRERDRANAVLIAQIAAASAASTAQISAETKADTVASEPA